VSYKYYWEDFYPGQVLETGGRSLSEKEIITIKGTIKGVDLPVKIIDPGSNGTTLR